MMRPVFLLYMIVFVQSLALSLIFVPVAMRLAQRWGFMDHPGQRKVHLVPKPLLGGAAIFASFVLVVFGNLLLAYAVRYLPSAGGLLGELLAHVQKLQRGVSERQTQLGGFIAGGCVVFLFGLADDKYGMSPLVKIAGQVIAALTLFFCGVRLDISAEVGSGAWLLDALVPLCLTVGWVVLLTNSFNLLDNMDGLSAGVGVITLAFFAVIAHLVEQQQFIVLVSCALIGAILGFLWYNFYPSRLFMGDAGSMFIGYSISSLTILSTYFIPTRTETRLALLIPLVVMAVPLFDTLSVVVIRISRGVPIYQGDKNHFSHRLVALGFSQREAVLMIYLVTASCGLAAVVIPKLPFSYGMVLIAQTVLIFAIISLLENVRRR